MKNWQNIDPKTASHEELIEAFYELYDEHITEESTNLEFVQKVVEFTVLAGPFLKDSLARKEIHGEGSILKMQMAIIDLNVRLEDLK